MSLGGLEGIVTASDGRTSRTKTPLGSSRAASAFSSSKSATEHSVSFAITEIEDYEASCVNLSSCHGCQSESCDIYIVL